MPVERGYQVIVGGRLLVGPALANGYGCAGFCHAL
jgi:hypothetical protein